MRHITLIALAMISSGILLSAVMLEVLAEGQDDGNGFTKSVQDYSNGSYAVALQDITSTWRRILQMSAAGA